MSKKNISFIFHKPIGALPCRYYEDGISTSEARLWLAIAIFDQLYCLQR